MKKKAIKIAKVCIKIVKDLGTSHEDPLRVAVR